MLAASYAKCARHGTNITRQAAALGQGEQRTRCAILLAAALHESSGLLLCRGGACR